MADTATPTAPAQGVTIVPSAKVTKISGTVIAPKGSMAPPAPEAPKPTAPTVTHGPSTFRVRTNAPPVPPPIEPVSEELKGDQPRKRATDDIYSDLRRRAQSKADDEKPKEAVEKQDAEPQARGQTEDEGKAPSESTEAQEGETQESTESQPAVTEKKGKVNPWKLLEEWKSNTAKKEAEIAELRKLVADESARKAELARLEKAESRAKELEDEIRYINYAKSKEFATKYEKPYEDAWKRAMAEVADIRIESEVDGQTRSVSPQDLLELVNMPLSRARERANELYGDYADDMMAHRQDIRRLFDERTSALERAKVEGAEREKQLKEEGEAKSRELQTFLADTWRKANEAALADEENGQFFKPAEGDEERSDLLARGYELVDKAFSESPMNPSLSNEDRVAIIRRHAAVRNRAAAYGTLKYLLKKEREAHEATMEKLRQYESSTPKIDTGTKQAEAHVPGSATAEVFAKLRSLAK